MTSLYGRDPHLLGDTNVAIPIDAEVASHEEWFKMIESARKKPPSRPMNGHLKTRMREMN